MILAKNLVAARFRAACAAAMLAVCGLAAAGSAVAQTAPPAPPANGGVAPSVTPGIAPVQSATSSNTPLPSQSTLYPGEDFQLAPGDLINVRLFGSGDYLATVRMGLDGAVELPYIGTVTLQGLTVRAAQAKVVGALREGGFYRDPQITIQVLESLNGSITISGEIKAVVPATAARRLIDVLAAAGGLPANASHTVRILRPGANKPIEVSLGSDLTNSESAGMLVYPRDIIQVSRAGVVYVLGAFRQQGSLPLDQAMPLTLMQLAALSGGVGFEGRYKDLRLIRTVGGERKLIQVDIKKVLNGKAPDPVLQANDIVFLPTDQMKAILKSLGVGGVLGLVSLVYSVRNF